MPRQPSAVRITRMPGPVAVDAIRASTLSALEALVPGDTWVVADLSLGSWRGHGAARQMRAALGLDDDATPPGFDGLRSVDTLPPYADVIGRSVDAEAGGDTTVLGALDDAERILASLSDSPGRSMLVIAPRFCMAWEPEDRLFLRFLAHGLRDTPHRLSIVFSDANSAAPPAGFVANWRGEFDSDAAIRTDSLLALVPGVIDADFALSLSGDGVRTHRLQGGLQLVAPEYRQAPAAAGRLAHDRLAVAAGSRAWLAAYARCHGNNIFVNAPVLCGEAWRRAAEGGVGIALRLLQRAIECGRTPEERALCLAHAQGLRISAQRFAEAAEAPDASHAIGGDLRAFLCQSKGWGLVMLGRAVEADRLLSEARELAEGHLGKREFLYLLNISALARFRSGQLDGAFEFERRIERELAGSPRRDEHLTFINSINLARLQRHVKAWDEARRYYALAFETVAGVRSESDAIYADVCSAIVETERGDLAAAFPFLLRAGLHLLASAVPEALPRRAVLAILARRPAPDEDAPEEVAEAVNRAVAQRLSAAAAVVLGSIDEGTEETVVPRISGTAVHPRRVVVGAGFCITVDAGPAPPPPFDGPGRRALERLVASIVGRLEPDAAPAPGECLLIDDGPRGMALDARGAMETALRLGCHEVTAGGERIVLDAAWRRRLEADLRVSVAPGAVEVSGRRVEFRRCLPPRWLQDREARLVDAVRTEAPSVRALARLEQEDLAATLAILRTLERDRVLALSLPEPVHGR